MIIIADSGSTKTDWIVLEKESKQLETSTMGFNPFLHSVDQIVAGIGENDKLNEYVDKIKQVFYYGAGCSSEDLKQRVVSALSIVFKHAEIVVQHDTVASAYASYNGEPCVTCILGTGSNSCLFDGESVSEVLPALGYILGDEGSGSYFGKKLLRDFLYKRMPNEITEDFKKKYNVSKNEILENVLSKPFANVYMASFAQFMEAHIETEYIQNMLVGGFKEFLSIHVACFENYKDLQVHFVGSIAHYYQNELRKAADSLGIQVTSVTQKPINGLVNYHLNYYKKVIQD